MIPLICGVATGVCCLLAFVLLAFVGPPRAGSRAWVLGALVSFWVGVVVVFV